MSGVTATCRSGLWGILLLLPLAVGCNILEWTVDNSSFDALMSDGRDAIQAGDYALAQEKFTAASTLRPQSADARYHLAKSAVLNADVDVFSLVQTLTDEADGVRRSADELCRIADLEAAVITLGSKGMYCRMADGESEWSVPARARAVYDVTGAGDTVIAALAFGLAAGAPLEQSVQLANVAAGLTVQRLGVAAISADDIERALNDAPSAADKVVDRDELLRKLADERKNGRTIVFTNGVFDVLHVGHLQYLQAAAREGHVLVVAVNEDDSVRRLKGPDRPVNALADRAALLAGLECVSLVTTFGEDTPLEIIRALTPDVLVKGADWAEKGVVGREWVEEHGGRVVLAALREGYSTTDTLRRMGRH